MMRRYSLIGAIAVTFSLAAAQSWGQEIKGPQAGAVQGTGQAAMGAERPAADAAGETARHDGNGQSLAAPALPNTPAGISNIGADIKQGSDARANMAPTLSPPMPPDARNPANVTGDGAPARGSPDPWRYRFENGRWWYWTPQNQWMWYGDNGWVAYDTAVPYTAAYGAYPVPVPVPSTGFYYPGYWYGGRYYYRPGVYVGVGGMRVGVGGGGGVRVRVGGYRYR